MLTAIATQRPSGDGRTSPEPHGAKKSKRQMPRRKRPTRKSPKRTSRRRRFGSRPIDELVGVEESQAEVRERYRVRDIRVRGQSLRYAGRQAGPQPVR